jgi:hypothetical protein
VQLAVHEMRLAARLAAVAEIPTIGIATDISAEKCCRKGAVRLGRRLLIFVIRLEFDWQQQPSTIRNA